MILTMLLFLLFIFAMNRIFSGFGNIWKNKCFF